MIRRRNENKKQKELKVGVCVDNLLMIGNKQKKEKK